MAGFGASYGSSSSGQPAKGGVLASTLVGGGPSYAAGPSILGIGTGVGGLGGLF